MYIPQLRIIQQHPTASNITADTMRAMLIQLDDLQHPGVLDVFEWEETAFQWMLNQVISCHFDFWCVSAALRAQPGTPNDGKMVLLGEPFLRSNIHHLRRQIRRYSKKISKENGQYLQNIRFFLTPRSYTSVYCLVSSGGSRRAQLHHVAQVARHSDTHPLVNDTWIRWDR